MEADRIIPTVRLGMNSQEYQFDLFSESLDSAKSFVSKNRKEGVVCPCCGQFSKIYKRKLNSTMSYGLLVFINVNRRNGFGKYYHMLEIAKADKRFQNCSRGGDFAKLAYWGFITEMPKDPKRTDSRTSGFWKATENGVLFSEGKITVPKYVYVYNQKAQGFSDEQINIKESLGNAFNYSELMGAAI